MRKRLLVLVLAFLPLGLMAQEQSADASTQVKETKTRSRVFTGFSGGMMLHGGYLFTDDPTKVFSNTGLGRLRLCEGSA